MYSIVCGLFLNNRNCYVIFQVLKCGYSDGYCPRIGKTRIHQFPIPLLNKTKSFLKVYLTLSVLILMFITSLGIFGYLTSSYQKSSLDSKLMDEKIVIYESQKSSAMLKIGQSKTRIENITLLRNAQEKRLSEAMTNNLIARNPIQLQKCNHRLWS